MKNSVNNPDFSDVEVRETVEVKGIQSHVRKVTEKGKENITLGHVLFLDFENTDIFKVRETCMEHFSTFYVFKSSGNNFHVINPVIRSLIETKELMDKIELQDQEHTEIGLQKGQWTLRVSGKGFKGKPELVFSCLKLEDDKLYSKPHLESIETVHDFDIGYHEDDLDLDNLDNVLGDSLKIAVYRTDPKNHERDNGDDS